MRARSRVLRVLAFVAKASCFLVLVLVCAIAALLVALDTAPVKGIVASSVTSLLKNLFRGSIVIEHIGSLSASGASGIRARVYDPDGHQVIHGDGLSARIDTVRLLRSLVSSGPIVVSLSDCRAAFADVSIETGAAMRVARAFEPKESSSPEPSSPGRDVLVTIDAAVLERGWAHGNLGGFFVDADLLDARAALQVTPSGVRISVPQANVSSRAMPLGADAAGIVTYQATFSPALPITMQGTFRGAIGGIRTDAEARLDGEVLVGQLTSERTLGPEPTLIGGAFVPDDLRLHVDVRGTLPKLDVRLHALSGPTVLDAEGTATVAPEPSAAATVLARHVDAHRFARSAPSTDLDVSARGSFELASGVPRASFVVETDPSILSGVPLPRVRATGTLRGQVLTANAVVEDPRGTARVAVGLRPSRTGPKVDVDAVLRVDDLGLATRNVVHGRGDVFAQGTVDLDQLRLNGQVIISAKDVSTGDAHVGRIYASSDLEGALEAPRYDAAFELERVDVGERRFRRGLARVRGTLGRSFFEALFEGESKAPSVAARGEASLDQGLTVRGLSVMGHRGGATVLAGASLIRVRRGELRIADATALGLGEPIRVSIAATPRLTEVTTVAPRVDLRRLARVVGLDPKRFSGESGADIDIRATPEETNGHLDVDLRKAVLGGETCGQGQLRAKFEGRRIDAEARGDWNGGEFDLHAKGLEIDGPPLEPESWARARGAVDLASDIDLAHLGTLLPADVLPFDELGGRAGVRVRLERDQSKALPTIGLGVKTKGLKLSRTGVDLQQGGRFVVRSPSPWHIEGTDIDVDLLIDPVGDRTNLRATVFDRRGTIVAVAFDSPALPLDLVRRPQEIQSFFERTPLHLSVDVPKRSFSDLPRPLARPAARGSVEFRAEASGLLRAPSIDASLVVDGLASRQSGNAPPFDGSFTAHYSEDEASVEGTVTRAGSVVAGAKARGHVPFAEVLVGDVRHFDVAGEVSFDEFPFQSLAALAAERVRGRLSGKVNATFGTDVPPRLQADLQADDVSVGRARHNQITLSVDADRDTLRAFARVKETDGSADARATLPIAFPFAAPSQVPPTARPGEVTFNARRFHLALLRPLADGVVSDLDGRVDGTVTIAVRDGGRQTSMTGGIRLTDGALGIPVLGEEFSAIGANVKLDGDNVSVDEFHAEGTTGEVNGSASFHVSGYSIDRAKASVKIPKGDPLPIEHEGESLADVWGTFDATFVRKDGSAPEIRVDVSKAGVLLPSLSSHAVQPLEPAERVRIGFMRRDGRFEIVRGMPSSESEKPEEEGMTIRIVAKDVEIRRGTDLRVRLDGEPVVKTGREEGVYGSITLRGGHLYVQGRKFEIEKGVITFDGEADNPNVVVTAAYAAPEDTRIYADFVGPLKTGKLTLRSDPPHTKSEILSLILFGTTTGNVAPSSGGGSSAAAAAGIGGGFAAQGLTRALDDLIGIDVTARVDTTQSANPRPEVEVRVARDVSVSVAHVLGVPPPGTNPDRNLAKIDFRLLRNWSLQTIVGDQGSTLFDLVWQYRY